MAGSNLEKATGEKGLLEADLARIKKSASESRSEVAALTSLTAELGDQVVELEKQAKELARELNSTRANLNETESALATTRLDLESKDDEMKKLSAKMAEKEKKWEEANKEAREKVGKLSTDNQKLSRELREKDSRVKSLEKTLANRTVATKTAEDAVGALASEVAHLQLELDASHQLARALKQRLEAAARPDLAAGMASHLKGTIEGAYGSALSGVKPHWDTLRTEASSRKDTSLAATSAARTMLGEAAQSTLDKASSEGKRLYAAHVSPLYASHVQPTVDSHLGPLYALHLERPVNQAWAAAGKFLGDAREASTAVLARTWAQASAQAQTFRAAALVKFVASHRFAVAGLSVHLGPSAERMLNWTLFFVTCQVTRYLMPKILWFALKLKLVVAWAVLRASVFLVKNAIQLKIYLAIHLPTKILLSPFRLIASPFTKKAKAS